MDKRSGGTGQIAVVGGSAAGLFTAYLLALRNLPIQVFEQADHLQPQPRTLVVTSKMRDLLGSIGQSAVINKIRRFELFADGRVASVSLSRPDLIIERSKLIVDIALHAQRFGAQIKLGYRFVGLEPNRSGLTLVMERTGRGATETVETQTVVGADGGASRVARATGWPPLKTVPLIQAVVQRPSNLPPDVARVWFVPEDTPYFFWLLPESATRAVLGLIGENGPQARRSLERFLEKQRLDPLGFQAARTPLYSGWMPVCQCLGAGRVYLVGDAAGHVKVTTVGGIVTGFRGALGVVEAIINGPPNSHLRELKKELNLHRLIRGLLHAFTQTDYSRLLSLLGAPAVASLSSYDRDEVGMLLWNLCIRQPRLLLFGLRALLVKALSPDNIKSRKIAC